jgi:cytoskeletal protein CcmA (bactofilin family)
VTPGSVNIEGTLDGDLWVAAPQVRISGVVTGDVFTAASDVNVTGEIKKSLRCAGANVVLDGIVDGGVVITGGTLMIGSKAHVAENVTAYGGQMTHHGIIDDTLTFAGGTAILGGKVQGDANITADAIEIEPGARIEGDVSYSTRKQMDAAIKAITGGDVAFEEKPIRERHALRERHHDGFHPSKFGIGVRIAFFVASFLFGCALLALFKQHEAKINDAIGNDTLRSAGLGFVSILVTIAVCLSGILILTLPFIAIYLLAYLFMVYLAKTPVAVWIGRKIFALAHRSTGPYVALLVGLVVLHLVFMIPVLGAVAWFAVALLGLGAMISVYIAQRQARKAAQASAALPEAPPAAS